MGDALGALGARKALTPAAHASATISRAIIAAEGSTRCHSHDDVNEMDVDADERALAQPVLEASR